MAADLQGCWKQESVDYVKETFGLPHKQKIAVKKKNGRERQISPNFSCRKSFQISRRPLGMFLQGSREFWPPVTKSAPKVLRRARFECRSKKHSEHSQASVSPACVRTKEPPKHVFGNGSVRSHSGTPALKTEDFSKKKSVVLVKRKNGFTKTVPWTGNKDRSVLVNPFSRFTKTTDFFTKILGLKGRGS